MAIERKKVIYSFIHQAGFMPDEKLQEELNILARKREGILHGFKTEGEDGEQKTLAIVEDLETGEFHEIDASFIRTSYEEDKHKEPSIPKETNCDHE